jgi:hypothetical protein
MPPARRGAARLTTALCPLHGCRAVGSTPADRATLAEPVGGSLLFAGEAVHVRSPSSLHGAYQSGVGQAGRVLAAMRFPAQDNATCAAGCYGSADVEVPGPPVGCAAGGGGRRMG